MHPPALALWHELVAARNARGLHQLIADDCVFHSPVVHTPQAGKLATIQYLAAAMNVFFNPTFKYVREVVGKHDAVLEFELNLEGIYINGVDMIRWNDAGKVTDFKVMLRPLKGVNMIHQKMAAMLQAQQQQQQ